MSNIARLMRMALVGGELSEYWIGVLGGAGDDQLTGVAVDSENNIVACGSTTSSGAGNTDGFIVKYGTLGELLWSRTLGGSGTDSFAKVAVDSSDDIVVGGATKPSSLDDGLVAKYNPLGTLLWTRTFATNSKEVIQGVAINSNNSIVIAGNFESIYFYVAGYNSSGSLTYNRFVAGPSSSESFDAVATDSADNAIVAGYTFSNTAGSADCVIGKYNSSGTQQWLRRLGGTGFDRFSSVAVDASNNIIAVGSSASVVSGITVALVVKYNASGTVLWSRRLNESGVSSTLVTVAVDSNDDIIVVGGALIAKYDTSGTLLWARDLLGGILSSVAVDSADNIIAAGRTTVVGAGGNDCLVVKLPPDGSGTGTYGSFVYQVAAASSASVSLSTAAMSVTFPSVTVTSAAAPVTDSPVALSKQYFPVNA
jgi:uncharacterized delta-60 repeat protein